MRKPTPQELAQLREAYPLGEPRVDYREMDLRILSEGYPPTGKATDNPVEEDQDELEEQIDGGDETDEEEEPLDSAKAAGKNGKKKKQRAADPNAPIPVAISSELPVLRYDWWEDERYYEVLDHSASSVDLSYSRDGLPFVASHRAWDADQQHGIVEDVKVGKDRVLRGSIRMSAAQRSQEIGSDIRNGIRKKVSVGYILGDDYEQTKGGADGIPVRRYKNWMPIEVSTVPIPADYSVGIGRAQSLAGQEALARFRSLHPTTPPKGQVKPMRNDATAPEGGAPATEQDPTEAALTRVKGIRERERQAEHERTDRLIQLGTQHGLMDRVEGWIQNKTTITDALAEVNRVLEERMQRPTQQAKPIALSKKDHERFSFARMMLLQDDKLERMFDIDPDFAGKRGKVDYGLEREVLTDATKRSPIPANAKKGGVFIPFVTQDDGRDLTMGERLRELHDRDIYYAKRGIDSATNTTGGPFKFTQPGDFIQLLRNKTSVLRAGVTVLSGLTGPVTFPKQSGPGSASWRAENPGSDISRVDLTTTTVTLSFKTIQAAMAVSRQALFSAASGNYDLEGIIRGDLAAIIGLAIDLAGLNGLGSSNQPLGLLQDTNVGTAPALGTNGGTIAWGNVVDLETAIGDANADIGTMTYLTNTKQRGVAKKQAVLGNTASGVPLWTGTPGIMDGQLNGYRAIASNQVPRNLTKGTSTTVCSAWVFGVFEHLLMGVFGGGFEMMTDPYTLKLQNLVDVTAWSFVDFANRYPQAFATLKDAL